MKKRYNRASIRKKKKKEKFYRLLAFCFVVVVFFSTYKLVKGIKGEIDHKKINSKNEIKKEKKLEKKNTLSKKEKTQEKKKNIHTEVLLSSAGDCTIGTDPKFDKSTALPTVVAAKNYDYSYLFKNVAPIFKEDDVTIVNLETTFTEASAKADKAFNFKAPPEFAKSLNLGSIEGVNVSNNHIYDFLEKGFKDTIDTLNKYKINYFGEGNKWIKEINGVKFGFLGYNGWTNDKKTLEKIKKDIEELKKQNCIIIVNFHWGIEKNYYPNEVQKYLARYSIDNGADLIIGHHPHVIQGLEKYKNKIICYSMGNFCFGGNSNPSDKDSFIFQAKFSFNNKKLDKYDIKIIPCSISSVSYTNNYCPTPLNGSEKERVINKINKLSKNIGFKVEDTFK